MNSLAPLPAIPASLAWRNEAVSSLIQGHNQLQITAAAETDWFVDPAGGPAKHNAPVALFIPPDEPCQLAAEVTVDFASTYDAGVLFVYEHDTLWAKLCFEFSPQHQPTIVSVVTRGASDDCNSTSLTTNTVHLRLYRQAEIFAFHYSLDGQYWSLVRYFTLLKLDHLTLGFSAQSPTGPGCAVRFANIRYRAGALRDLRDGT
jgi:uncharacterized protein